jgi:hypothetical protein
MVASANFTVNGNAVPPEAAVSASSTVTLALLSTSGVDTVSWSIIGNHGEAAVNPTITPAGTPLGATATFPMPAGAGQAYLLQCQINGGVDSEGVEQSSYTKTALVGVLDASGYVPFAFGETFERSATHGTVEALNNRTAGGGGGGTTNHSLLTNLTADDHAHYDLAARPAVAYSGAASTVVLADARKHVTTSHGSANTLTIPPNASVAFATGTLLYGTNIGAGAMTLTAGAGVTLNGSVAVAQHGWWWAKKTNTNTWQTFVGGGGGSSITAGNGLTDTAGTFSVDAEDATIVVGVGGIKRAPITGDVTIADGSNAAVSVGLVKADGTVPLSAAWDVGNQAIDDVKSISYEGEVDNGNSSTADTIDWTTGLLQKSTLTGNCTYTFTAPPAWTPVQLRVVQDATGGRTVTWPGTVVWDKGYAPVMAGGPNAETIISGYYDGTNYRLTNPDRGVRIVTETGTTRTTVATDANALIDCTHASGCSVTIPPHSSVPYEIGTAGMAKQSGAAQVTLVAGAGVTLITSETLKTLKQHSVIGWLKLATNTWLVFGERELA